MPFEKNLQRIKKLKWVETSELFNNVQQNPQIFWSFKDIDTFLK